jgi:hypothetical protein
MAPTIGDNPPPPYFITMSPEIRLVVVDTTGPAERLAFVPCPRAVALAFHGLRLARPAAPRLVGNEKPRQRG